VTDVSEKNKQANEQKWKRCNFLY